MVSFHYAVAGTTIVRLLIGISLGYMYRGLEFDATTNIQLECILDCIIETCAHPSLPVDLQPAALHLLKLAWRTGLLRAITDWGLGVIETASFILFCVLLEFK
jgi:hypothetical protein